MEWHVLKWWRLSKMASHFQWSMHIVLLWLGEVNLVRLRPVWMTNHPPSVLWHCWLGHQTCNTSSLKWPKLCQWCPGQTSVNLAQLNFSSYMTCMLMNYCRFDEALCNNECCHLTGGHCWYIAESGVESTRTSISGCYSGLVHTCPCLSHRSTRWSYLCIITAHAVRLVWTSMSGCYSGLVHTCPCLSHSGTRRPYLCIIAAHAVRLVWTSMSGCYSGLVRTCPCLSHCTVNCR